MPGTGRYFEVRWLKRYAISCLIAMFALAVEDGYHRPGMHQNFGSIITMGVAWPVTAAVVVGIAVGEVARESGKEQAPL